jgi:MFS family permease
MNIFANLVSFFSIRYLIILLGSFGVMFANESRAILSIVILPLSNEHGWSETTQGLLLGAFSFGYFFTQIPSLWLERKIGCKKMLLIAVSLSGLFIFIFPFVVPNVPLCILCYICVGLAQGPLWVVAYNLIVDWLLESERQVGLSTFTLMALMGTATGLGLSPIIFR